MPIDIHNNPDDLNDLIKIKRDKIIKLQKDGKDPFQNVKYDRTHLNNEIIDNFDNLEGETVSVAGRIMTRRLMGKASFINLKDRNATIQVYLRKDVLGDEVYEEFLDYDLGDIIGVEGEVFKTQKDEISIRANSIVLLSKSMQIMPDKWDGLKDMDLKYRQRYTDLIINDDVRETFIKRSQIIRAMRKILDDRGFIEVETPVLQPLHGGANARPFITHHNALDMKLYLRIAVELYLKRLIVGGLERVYEIGPVFRNEGMSTKHNPEFTMMELYQAYTDYNGMMDITEDLYRLICKEVVGSTIINYQGTELNLEKKFERITMIDSILKYKSVDFNEILTTEDAKKVADEYAVEYEDHDERGNIIEYFFDEFVEAKLIQPTFITEHPWEISPLSKKSPTNEAVTERFEMFLYGRECANAYSELNDPIDQRMRFEHQQSLKDAGDEEAHAIDEDYIKALEYAMPPTGGLGIGIDRMVMFFTDSPSIKDVLLFPTMKPL